MTTWYHHPTPNTSTGSCPTRINSLSGSKILITWQRWTTTKTLFYVKLMILFALICNREPTVTRRLFHLESSYAMRLLDATITSTSEIAPGMHLIEMHAPSLAHATQPGQYCMVRCCAAHSLYMQPGGVPVSVRC